MFDVSTLLKLHSKGGLKACLNSMVENNEIRIILTHVQYDDLQSKNFPYANLNLKAQTVPTCGAVTGISYSGMAFAGSDEDHRIIEEVKKHSKSFSLGLLASTASSFNAVLVTDNRGFLSNFEKIGLSRDPYSWKQFTQIGLQLNDYDYTFPIEKNKDRLMQIFDKVKSLLIPDLKKHPEIIKRMDRREFEILIAELFSDFGYDVELTRRTGDGGADIIALKNKAYKNDICLIQCKRPDEGNKVSVEPIRELYGVMKSSGSVRGILATSAIFTKDAEDFLKNEYHSLQGRDYNDLQEWIAQYKQ